MIEFVHKTHPRSRSLKLKIEPNGDVVVVSPPRFPSHRIQAFVDQHLGWIAQTQAKLLRQKPPRQTSTTVEIFGKEYLKEIVFSRELPVGIKIKNPGEGQPPRLVINTIKGSLDHPSLPEAEAQLERFLKQTAEKFIIPRTHQLAKTMDISFKRISLRNQKTRWGSCSSYGNLNFNWRLVHYAPEIIDYVIIHELAHRREMNHSHRFWQIVRQYDPAFDRHRGWLKRHGWAEG